MKLAFVLPVRSFSGGKSRLAQALQQQDREKLNWVLYRHVLRQLRTAFPESTIIVVTSDGKVLDACVSDGVVAVFDENQPATLSGAVSLGAVRARILGSEYICYLPTDLPFLTASKLREMLDRAMTFGATLIVPGASQDTTAMLLTFGSSDFPYHFGSGSFSRHLSSLLKTKLPIIIHREHCIESDLDEVQDLTVALAGLNEQATAGVVTDEQAEILEILRSSR